MLRESESEIAIRAIRIASNGLQGGAIHCVGIHARAARGMWPQKTAEHWAAKAGVKVRMAQYWLAGTHPVSADGRLALIRELQ